MDPVEVVLKAMRAAMDELGVDALRITSLQVAMLTDKLLENGAVLGGVAREPEGLREEDLDVKVKKPEQDGGLYTVRVVHRPTSLAVYRSGSTMLRAKSDAIEALTGMVRAKSAGV